MSELGIEAVNEGERGVFQSNFIINFMILGSLKQDLCEPHD